MNHLPRMTGQQPRRVAAVPEVLGVFLVGGFITDQLVRLSGIPVMNPLGGLTVHMSGRELITAARQLFILLIFQYASYFLLIIPINWWRRRRGASAYGLTKAGHSWRLLLLAGKSQKRRQERLFARRKGNRTSP